MMRFLLIGAVLMLSPLARAATNPGERYLGAYFLIQEAEDAQTASDWAGADAKFRAALKILGEIRTEHPDWNSTLVTFRTKYCADRLAAIESKVPAAPTPTTPEVELPPPTGTADQVRQLQAELQKTREDVKRLEALRDELTARLEEKLKEAAPTESESAQQMLERLRSMQAANEAVSAQLQDAKQKAARADALEAELRRSRDKITSLETERNGLNTRLQDALGKLSARETTPQVEELLKKNADLTAELASAQAAITQMRDELAGATAGKAESEAAVQLRAEVGKLQSELEQTKVLLAQRSEELGATRAELERVRAENIRLTQSQADLMARLNESDRQLRAAKASTEKDNEIILQLRKENALLREVAGKAAPEPPPPPTAARPRGGFLWFKPRQPATQTNVTEDAGSVAHSEAGKLTAAVKAPTPPSSAEQPAATASPTSSDATIVARLLADARVALTQRDFPAAESKFQSVLAQDAGNADALSGMGVVYYQQSRLGDAEDVLRKAVTVAPNDSRSRALLGILYYRKGQIEDAYTELTRAVALNPRNAEAHNYLGIVMSEKGWASAAEQEVRRAIELNPQYADAHFNLAVIYSRQKTPRLELARYHYQHARDLGAERDEKLEALLGLSPSPAGAP
jgi:Flp pilus assembly protein TadD